MKTNTASLLTLAALCFSCIQAPGQTPAQMTLINPVAIGIRLSPDGGGLTGKVFINRNWVFEAQICGSQGFYHMPDNGPAYGPSWSATALGEYHIIFQDPSWRIYFGAGLHTGKWDKYDHATYNEQPQPEGIFGAEGILGVEYLFKSVPVGISADAKPAVNISSFAGLFPNNLFGLSFRYYFGRKIVIRVAQPEPIGSPEPAPEFAPKK